MVQAAHVRRAEGPFEGGASPFDVTRATGSVFEAAGRWWLVHTKPRNEKALSEDMQRMGVPHFLPLARVPRRYGGARSFVQLPLFPSYLFLRGDEEHRHATLSTHRVVSVQRVVDQEQLQRELVNLERVTSSGEPVDLYPKIRKGRRCVVIKGSLKGVQGTVLRRCGVCRVYLAVSLLGQSAEVEIDPSLLETCE